MSYSIRFAIAIAALGNALQPNGDDGSSGNAAVVLTLPGNAGTVHVTAEGPFGLGHPVVTFTETVQ
jgi:hypothetical protein